MRYSDIIHYDTGNARGLSTVLFVNGCSHHCFHCHNIGTWDREKGHLFTEETKSKIIKSLEPTRIRNFVISGGDPLEPYNAPCILDLCQSIRKNESDKHLSKTAFILYTGYILEQDYKDFEKPQIDLLKSVDYIIDGPYIEDQATKILDYRGSVNQNCYKVVDGDFVLYNEYFKDTEAIVSEK